MGSRGCGLVRRAATGHRSGRKSRSYTAPTHRTGRVCPYRRWRRATRSSHAQKTRTHPDNSPATGVPTITGTAQVGETLTADTSGIADADGLANATFSYQWLADDSEISGATNATYTLVAADEGKAVKVQVGFTDDAGNEETLTSTANRRGVGSARPTPSRLPTWRWGTPSVYPASPFAGSQFTLSVHGDQCWRRGFGGGPRLRGYRSTDSTITTSDTEEGSQTVQRPCCGRQQQLRSRADSAVRGGHVLLRRMRGLGGRMSPIPPTTVLRRWRSLCRSLHRTWS